MYIMFIIAEMYDFKLHIVRSNSYGSLIANSTQWNGVVGLLQRRIVDIGAHSIAYTKARLSVVENGFSVVKYRQSFIFRHPTHVTGTKKVFLMPLDEKVWWSLLGISICAIIVLFMINLAEKNTRVISLEDIWTLSLINVVALLSQQGLSSDHLKSSKAKVVIIFILFLSFICFQFYSASIVGSLLAPTPRTIVSIPKLIESGLKIAMEEHPTSHLIWKVLSDPDVQELYDKRIKGQQLFLPVIDGLLKVKTGQYALLVYYDDIPDLIKSTLNHDEFEELQVIPLIPQNARALLALPYQKDSPFSEIIRVGILKVIEVGLKEYHWNKWITNLNEKTFKNVFNTAVVDFARVDAVFYFLFLGYFVSLVTFVGELVVRKILDHKNNVLVLQFTYQSQ